MSFFITSGSLWNYYRDEINNVANENNASNNNGISNNKTITNKSFEYKKKIIISEISITSGIVGNP